MPYCVRLMRGEDIAQVTEIDHEAFPTLWPPTNYQHEVRNPLAHYIVAYDDQRTVEERETHGGPKKGLPRVLTMVRGLFGLSRLASELPPSGRQYIVGFAGFWIMADEAHITNIAVRESHRRLLISTIGLATELKARIIALEVRASNTAAQDLYGKYGLKQVGLRRGYYVDDKEDAILMSTKEINSAAFQSHFRQLQQAHSRKLGIALYGVAR